MNRFLLLLKKTQMYDSYIKIKILGIMFESYQTKLYVYIFPCWDSFMTYIVGRVRGNYVEITRFCSLTFYYIKKTAVFS